MRGFKETDRMRSRLSFLFALLLTLAGAAPAAFAADDWVVRESSVGVETTVERLQEAIVRSGSKVLAVFDHREAAQEVGLDIAQSTVVLFAKPKSATPIIAQNPRAAIEMPQRILVWEEEGRTYVGFVSPTMFVTRHGFSSGHPELGRLRAGLEALVSATVKRRDERADAGH